MKLTVYYRNITGTLPVIKLTPNTAHNRSGGKAGYLSSPCPGLSSNVLWVAFSIPAGSLSLVKYPVDLSRRNYSLGFRDIRY
jgi:hypothetical protein